MKHTIQYNYSPPEKFEYMQPESLFISLRSDLVKEHYEVNITHSMAFFV